MKTLLLTLGLISCISCKSNELSPQKIEIPKTAIVLKSENKEPNLNTPILNSEDEKTKFLNIYFDICKRAYEKISTYNILGGDLDLEKVKSEIDVLIDLKVLDSDFKEKFEDYVEKATSIIPNNNSKNAPEEVKDLIAFLPFLSGINLFFNELSYITKDSNLWDSSIPQKFLYFQEFDLNYISEFIPNFCKKISKDSSSIISKEFGNIMIDFRMQKNCIFTIEVREIRF